MWHQKERQDFPPKNKICNTIEVVILKLFTLVVLIKIQVLYKNQTCDINRSNNTFFHRKSFDTRYRGRNFYPIDTKFGTNFRS